LVSRGYYLYPRHMIKDEDISERLDTQFVLFFVNYYYYYYYYYYYGCKRKLVLKDSRLKILIICI